ncbi:MAG: 50S ribosomal protein L9, partial [Gammaproteobacteria bacterium]|nr:50S ribosomal protein L9 [Gammaproteobacteria bacterium]
IAAFEARRAELEKVETEMLAAAEARREQLDGKTINIAARVGDEGKLFGSIGTADITDAVKAAGVDIERNEVRLPEGAFRLVGEYDVTLHLYSDVNATIKLVITAE